MVLRAETTPHGPQFPVLFNPPPLPRRLLSTRNFTPAMPPSRAAACKCFGAAGWRILRGDGARAAGLRGRRPRVLCRNPDFRRRHPLLRIPQGRTRCVSPAPPDRRAAVSLPLHRIATSHHCPSPPIPPSPRNTQRCLFPCVPALPGAAQHKLPIPAVGVQQAAVLTEALQISLSRPRWRSGCSPRSSPPARTPRSP